MGLKATEAGNGVNVGGELKTEPWKCAIGNWKTLKGARPDPPPCRCGNASLPAAAAESGFRVLLELEGQGVLRIQLQRSVE